MKIESSDSFGLLVRHRKTSRNPLLETWAIVGTLILISIVSGWYLAGGTSLDLHVPLSYGEDGLLVESFVKRVMDNSWINISQQMGAPFGSLLYDYPVPDSGSLLVLKLIGSITQSAGVAFNVYFLAGFPLNALAAYFAMRGIGASRLSAFTGALVFTWLPFHTMRIAHLFYTWYFVAPIFIWIAFRIYSENLDLFRRASPLKHCSTYLGLLALSCFGVYYAFFGVLTLLTAGLLNLLRNQGKRALATAILASAIVGAGVVANVTPNLLYRMHKGPNIETAQRQPSEAELYGLKLAQLVLPRPAHRSNVLAALNNRYSSTFPLVNENATSSLGMIGTFGLLIQLVILFIPGREKTLEHKAMYLMAVITLILFLFCTVGGLSAVFNLLITPMIRAWNRVSVFIGFSSITAFMLLAQSFWVKIKLRGRATAGAAAVLLLAFAFWDQTITPCRNCLRSSQASFQSDADFVHSIETILPKGNAVYQLPYFPFPENIYTQLKGYLHSSNLLWSFGGIRGREGDSFFRALAEQPVGEQIQIARKIGFSGVYLDLADYPDRGVTILQDFSKALGSGPTLTSKNGDTAFFDLRNARDDVVAVPVGSTPEQIMNQADFFVDSLGERYKVSIAEGISFAKTGAPSFLKGLTGLSDRENWGRWSDANLERNVTISFKQPLPPRFTMHIVARGYGPNAGVPCEVVVGSQTRTFIPSQSDQEFVLSFGNQSNASTIVIRPASPITPHSIDGGADMRAIGIGFVRIWFDPIDNPGSSANTITGGT
jgi:phosphoglycerol transferase